MDFDQVVTNEEIYDPDSQVVRSQATITEEGNSGQNVRPVTVAQNIPNGDGVTNSAGTFNQIPKPRKPSITRFPKLSATRLKIPEPSSA